LFCFFICFINSICFVHFHEKQKDLMLPSVG
jgi:hypothetical protein